MKKMIKKLALFVGASIMVCGISNPAYAGFTEDGIRGSWKKDDHGWQWENEDGTRLKNTWKWIDVAENRLEYCFYFDENGYRVEDTITPDGYYVNIEGKWMEGNTVMTKYTSFDTVEEYRNWLFAKRSIPYLVSDGNNIKLVNSHDGSGIHYREDGWCWLDLDGDWKEERCYFDINGNMVKDSVIPEHIREESGSIVAGGEVNKEGALIVDGVVQTREQVKPAYSGLLYERPHGTELTDPNSFAKVSFNQELVNYAKNFPYKPFQDFKTLYPSTLKEERKMSNDLLWQIYLTTYRNQPLQYEGYEELGHINIFNGTVSQVMNGIPESGVESNALLKNTGYEKGGIIASTGSMDRDFGLPTGRYRVLQLKDRENAIQCFIVVTIGSDGKWYIYPENKALLGQG